jgi:hypothetical protein
MEIIVVGKGFGYPMMVPPGTPPDRVKIIRESYAKVIRDRELIAEAQKGGWVMVPVSGEELQSLADCLNTVHLGNSQDDTRRGPPSCLSALYKLLQLSLISRATLDSSWARAISPSAHAIPAGTVFGFSGGFRCFLAHDDAQIACQRNDFGSNLAVLLTAMWLANYAAWGFVSPIPNASANSS